LHLELFQKVAGNEQGLLQEPLLINELKVQVKNQKPN